LADQCQTASYARVYNRYKTHSSCYARVQLMHFKTVSANLPISSAISPALIPKSETNSRSTRPPYVPYRFHTTQHLWFVVTNAITSKS